MPGLHRHPPPHLADGAARDLRRLDADRLLPRRALDALAALHRRGRLRRQLRRARSRRSTPASRRSSTSRTATTRRSTPTARSRACATPASARSSPTATSRRRGPSPTSPRTRCAWRTPGACSASSTALPGGLVTMGISLTEPGLIPFADTQAEVETARELGAVIATHTACIWGMPSGLDQFAAPRAARPRHRPRALQRLHRARLDAAAALRREDLGDARRPRCRWAWVTRRSAARSSAGSS